MKTEEKMLLDIEEMLLSFAEEKDELTTSDFQGRAYVVARKIAEIIKGRHLITK
jgi:hypothetical protein